MTTNIRRLSLAVAAATVAACGADRTVSARTDALLSDARSDGAAGFYFLPPVAPEPGEPAENDPGLSPRVVIDALAEDGSVAATFREFRADEVKASGGHYMVHWSTRLLPPVIGTTYRIRVLLDGAELGFADAKVATSGQELRLLGSDEIFGIKGQRTIPIKFRIAQEEPAFCAEDGAACDDGDSCTYGDVCAGGACTSAEPLVCPMNGCNTGACDATGCVHLPNDSNCPGGACLYNAEYGYSECIASPGSKLSP